MAGRAEEGAGLGAAEGSRTTRVATPPRHPGRLGGRGFCREDQSCVAARGSWPRLLKGPRRGWGAGEEEEEVEEREEEVEAEKAEEAWWGCRVGTWSGARGAER